MKAIIENYDLLEDEDHEKKILSALNRIKKAIDDINNLSSNYSVYMAEHGSFNVMNVEKSGGYKRYLDYDTDMVVANVNVDGIGGGAW